MWQTPPFAWTALWPRCLALTGTQMPQLGQNVGYDPVTVTWVPSPRVHLNEEQVRPARSRQSSSTHPWHQAMEHAAVPVLMWSRWTCAIRDDITLHCTHTLGSCYIGEKEKEKKKLQNLDDKLGRTNVSKPLRSLSGLRKRGQETQFQRQRLNINTRWQF